MIILPKDKNIVSLLPPDDSKQLLMALFSDSDLPEMTPLAYMAYTAIKSASDGVSKARSKAGNEGGAPNGNRNAAKQAQPSTDAPKQTKQATQAKRLPETDAALSAYGAVSHGCGGAANLSLMEQRFIEFWAIYPRKVGKEFARKAWRRINPTPALHAKILAAINAAIKCEQWQRENGRYIPNPSTWLNQGRWDDENRPAPVVLHNRNCSNFNNFTQRKYDDDYFEQFITSDFGNK